MGGSTIYFYVTVAAVTFLLASAGVKRGGRRGGRAAGGGRRGGGAKLGRRSGRAAGGKGRAAGSGKAKQRAQFWSYNTVALFVAGFGIGGFFAAELSLPAPATVVAGAFGGSALAALDYATLRLLLSREGSSALDLRECVGLTATVEISIIGNGIGRVRCERERETATLLARSDGSDLPVNSLVRVKSVAGSMVVVEPVDEAEAPFAAPSAWRG